MRVQSSLGELSSNKTQKDRTWNSGALLLGEVTKVYNKRNTADVKFLKGGTSDSLASVEGLGACRILVSNAGYDTSYNKPFGDITPIQVGSTVLVGFIDNNKSDPVILGVLHDNAEGLGSINYKNILTSTSDSDSEEEKYRKTSITRSQDYVTIDGLGNFELYSHSRSFLIGSNEKDIDEETFDVNDLKIKNPDATSLAIDESKSEPKKFLAVFKKFFQVDLRDSLRIFIDPLKLLFRINQINNTDNTTSSISIEEDGAIRIKKQYDSEYITDSSVNFTEVALEKTGNIKLSVSTLANSTIIDISANGIKINTKDNIEVSTNSNINLIGKDFSFKGKNIDLDGVVNINGKANINGNVETFGNIHASGEIINNTLVVLKRDETEDEIDPIYGDEEEI